MTTLLLIATCLNLILVLGLTFNLFLRIKEKKEDQRINKGLQLLQHKISILQDLSDKADEQVHRLVHLLDKKSNELKKVTTEAQQSITFLQNKNNIATPEELLILKKLAETEIDQLSQFAEAISMQNDRIKSKIENKETVNAGPQHVPQTFVESVDQTEVKNKIRAFEFKRI